MRWLREGTYATLRGSRNSTADDTRREMLGGLEESFQSLESGSKNMLSQVRITH